MRRSILVVCDSLRRDLIAPNVAPALAQLAESGCNFAQARSVFPSTTRASSASIATGCHPGRHGLYGNNVVLDEGDGLRCHIVGAPGFRDRMIRATGRTLRMPTLAERLHHAGGAMMVSNASPGATLFQDPDGFGHVYHRSGDVEPGRKRLASKCLSAAQTGEDGDALATELFCERLLTSSAPVHAVLWLSEPDATGHKMGLGSAQHRVAIASADRCVARVLETVHKLERRGDDVLFIGASDHGMETIERTIDIAHELVRAGLKDAPESGDVVAAPNGTSVLISLAPAARGRMRDLAAFLRSQDWVEQVFSAVNLARVKLPHDGHVQLALTMRTYPHANAHGVAGKADTAKGVEDKNYQAQHGGLGPNEQAPFLFVHGGGFAQARRTDHPASLVDIAPTILRHLGRDFSGMDGCPLPIAPMACVAAAARVF